VRVSARADYAIRALLELTAAGASEPVRGDAIARAQAIPAKYLENLLADLRRARLIASQRGVNGGYRLARPASAISLADVIRAIDGPLAGVRDAAPEDVEYTGPAASLRDVWVALRASMRTVLEATTLADVAAGKLPAGVRRLLREPDAWTRR
jgi:Rrf2 family protein